jgi:hypothetical protein
LVVMSRQWTSIRGADGTARLHACDDVVCWEVRSALDRSVPVLPVLVGGARMPNADELPEPIRALAGITALDMSDSRWEQDFERLVKVANDKGAAAAAPAAGVNPFSMHGGIREDAFFFDRKRECGTLQNYLAGGQSCQLVGQRRIGKTSILRYVERHAVDWLPAARIAYIDLQDPRCYTLAGWLNEVAGAFELSQRIASLSDLMEAIESMLARRVRPILCLDEFGQMTRRKQEFPPDVYFTLRACGQLGMSILTAAPKKLSELTDPHDDSSPFFNTFAVLPIGGFSRDVALDYVNLARSGVGAFTENEVNAIVVSAKGHPLKLQLACFHVLAGRESGEDLSSALERAEAAFTQ